MSKGDIVSFYYTILTRQGVPVHPEVYRIRNDDTTWEDVISNHIDTVIGSKRPVDGMQ